ncbi:MAG: DNA polymerase III subunit beta [Arenimonas sp.]|nr:DNA polymerase III subunit beta [Arenimonas sp.]
MRFNLTREAFLKPLQQVVNVVERRQTLPVLSNLLVQVENGLLSVKGTDLEVELTARTAVDNSEDGEVTIPARKLFDIVRALPDGSKISLSHTGDKVTIQAGKSRYTLATLPAKDFPENDQLAIVERIKVPEAALKELIERTAFAMAQQDVRYYLNGLLFDLKGKTLRCVSTDGHRLALCETELHESVENRKQIIMPRKGVLELQRLLEDGDGEIVLEVGNNHLRVSRSDVTFSTKLIEGKFPDYEAVIPIGADKEIRINRELFRNALQRAAILSNEKFKGVKLDINLTVLNIVAHNPEQEEAQEEIEIESAIDGISIGFNVNYLLEALSALREDTIIIMLRDGNSSALVREASHERSRHVVMPLRL